MMLAVVMTFVLVACGGSNREIADMARYIVREAAVATANNDYARLQQIVAEEQAYCATLSADELEYYNQQALAAGAELMEALY